MRKFRKYIGAGIAVLVLVLSTGLFSRADSLRELAPEDTGSLTPASESAPASSSESTEIPSSRIPAAATIPSVDPIDEESLTGRYRDQLSPQGQAVYDAMQTAFSSGEKEDTVSFDDPLSLTLSVSVPTPDEKEGDESTPDWYALLPALDAESAAAYAAVTGLPLQALLLDHPDLFNGADADTIGFAAEPAGEQSDETTASLTGIRFRVTQSGEPGDALEQALEAFPITGDTRYEQLLSIHDGLIRLADYERRANNQAAGALLDPHEASGAGYARAFQLLCNRADIPSLLVSGKEGVRSTLAPHMWNLVQMEDGSWYGIDTAWDDKDPMSRRYFLSGAAIFHTSHTPGDAFLFQLPSINDASYRSDMDDGESTKITVEQLQPPVADGQWVYGKTPEESDVSITGGVFHSPVGDVLTGRLEWLETETAAAGDGAQTARYHFVPSHTEYASFTGEISLSRAPQTLTVRSATVKEKPYDGTTAAQLQDLVIEGLLVDDQALLQTMRQEADVRFLSPAIGNDLPFTLDMTSAMQALDNLYTLPALSQTFSGGTIVRAAATAEVAPLTAPYGVEETISIDLDESVLFHPTLPDGISAGSLHYRIGTPKNTSGILRADSLQAEGSVLSFSTTANEGEGETTTIPIVIESAFCEPVSLDLHIERPARQPVSFSLPVANKSYDGTPIAPGTPSQSGDWTITYSYTGTRRDGDAYGPSADPPIDAGSYTLTATLDGSAHTGTYSHNFLILPRTVTVRAEANPVLVGEKPYITYAYDGFAQGESASTPHLLQSKPFASPPATDKSGRYPLSVQTLPTACNYLFTAARTQGTLTVETRNPDDGYYTVQPKGADGWYQQAARIVPTGKDGFDQLLVAGSDTVYTAENPLLLGENNQQSDTSFYLVRSDSEIRTDSTVFRCGIDTAPPLITNVSFAANESGESGTLTVDAMDRFSGTDTVALTAPNGVVVAQPIRQGSASFTLTQGGDYTVQVTDRVGNAATEWRQISFSTSTTTNDATPKDRAPFWEEVTRQLAQAPAGSALVVELQDVETVPETLIAQLTEHDVLLVLCWPQEERRVALSGDDVSLLVPGGYGFARLQTMAGEDSMARLDTIENRIVVRHDG